MDSAIHAGNYVVDYQNILVSGANNMASNYTVTCKDITFKINCRTINVKILDMKDMVYDGNYHSYPSQYENFKTDDTLYNNDKIQINVQTYKQNSQGFWEEVSEIKDFGKYEFLFNNSWKVSSGYTKDYAVKVSNYDLFEIFKLKAKIGIINPGSYFESYYTSIGHVYNGEYKIHSNNSGHQITKLPDKAVLSIGYYKLIVDGDKYIKGEEIGNGVEVGEYYCTSKALTFDNPNVKDNYEITFNEDDYSILKIIQSELNISLKQDSKINGSKVYDGTRLKDVSSSSEANVNVTSNVINVDSKVFKHTISVDMRYYSADGTYIAPPKNVGTYVEKITNVYVDGQLLTYDAEEKCYYNKNLKIYTSDTNVSISKKNIQVNIKVAEQKFDGKEYEVKQKDISFIDSGLVSGDILEITNLKFKEGTALHAGKYNIDPKSVEYTLTHLDNDVSNNYNLIFAGSLTIAKRVIEISVNDLSLAYTGADIEIKNYFFTFEKDSISSAYGLVYDYTIYQNGVEVSKINEVGTYKLVLNDIKDSSGNSIANNKDYTFSKSSINKKSGEIVVVGYDVFINTGSQTFIYSANVSKYYCYDFEVDYTYSHLVKGHKVVVDESKSPYLTSRGFVQNKLVFKIVDEEGNDVTENYNIYYNNIGLVSVVTSSTIVSSNYYYSGSPDSFDSIASTLQLSSDDTSLYGTQVILEDYKLFNRRGVDCTNTVVETVTGYKLYVKVSFNLNGESIDPENLAISNEIVDGYYVLDFAVLHRPISIKAKDIVTTYSANPVSVDKSDYVVTSDLQLIEGHYAKIYTSLEVTDAGIYTDNEITRVVIYDENGKNVSRYYLIDVSEYSTIQINPMTIYVTTPTASYYYDGSEFTSKDFTLHTELLADHKIDYEETVYSSRSIVGITKNYVYPSIKDGSADVSGNYKVEYQKLGTITVEKSTILVVTESKTKEYDGTTLSCKEYKVYLNGVLVSGNKINDYLKISVEDFAQIEEPGTIKNTCNLIVNKSNSNVSKYFDITYNFGDLTITLTE